MSVRYHSNSHAQTGSPSRPKDGCCTRLSICSCTAGAPATSRVGCEAPGMQHGLCSWAARHGRCHSLSGLCKQ